jgi:outer membrane protein assembly factor BamB
MGYPADMRTWILFLKSTSKTNAIEFRQRDESCRWRGRRLTRMLAIVCLGSPLSLVVHAQGGLEPPSHKPPTGNLVSGHDWPDFLGPKRDGKSSEGGLNFSWMEAGPPLVWKLPLGTGYTAPTISDGRLFQFDRHGDEDRLVCFEAISGRQLWAIGHPTDFEDMLGYDNGPRCSAVVDGPRVFTFSAGGILQCVRAADGERIWLVDTAEEFGVVKNFFGVGSTPLVVGDLLIANIGGSPEGSPPDVYSANGNVLGNGSGIVAFDKKTGTVRWQATDELASYASPVVAKIADQTWCFVFARGGLVGFDPHNGKVEFEYPWRARIMESVNASTPIVVGNEVFISETYGPGSSLLRVHRGGYDVVWKDDLRNRQKAMMLHWNTPIYHDGYLYGCSGRHANTAELRCIEWSTGKIQWSEPCAGRASLLYADGYLIGLVENGTLLLMKADREKYELLRSVVLRDDAGRRLLQPPAWTSPVLANGHLYLRGRDQLVCLDLTTSED